MRNEFWGLPSGATEKHLAICPNIDSSNPENATAIHGRESKTAKLSVLSGSEGCMQKEMNSTFLQSVLRSMSSS